MTMKKFMWIQLLGLADLFTIIFFWQNTLVCFGCLAAISLCMLLVYRSRDICVFFALMVPFAMIAEISLVASGAWTYTTESFYGIPMWLPLAWGNALTYGIGLHLFIKEVICSKTP